MNPVTPALAADAEVTGAPPGSELDQILALQDLKLEDIEANRAGRVSARQIDIVDRQRKRWDLLAFVLLGLVMSLGPWTIAFVNYLKDKTPGIFIWAGAMTAMALVIGVIYLLVLRWPSVSGHQVTVIQAPFASLMVITTRNGFTVRMNGVSYRGVGSKLPSSLQGKTFKAYVDAEHKLLLAFEPVQ